MTSKIALFLCILFILYLFKIDVKRSLNVSSALWIPLIWMLIISSRMPALWINQGVVTPELMMEGNPLNRNVLGLLIMLGVLTLIKRKVSWAEIIHTNTILFIFFIYCGNSILWSDYPSVALKRWIKALGNPIMALVVLTETVPIDAIKTLIRRSAYVLIPLSVVFIKYFPLLGREYHRYTDQAMYTGVATGKNGLGLICLVFGLYFISELIANWRIRKKHIDKITIYINVLLLLMILWLFSKADSATAFICFVIGPFILFGLGSSFFKKRSIPNLLYIFIVIIFLSPFILSGSESLLSRLVDFTGHSDTFWGRVALWPKLIHMMDASSLIGTGYDSYWLGDRLVKLWNEFWWNPTEAHNGYLGTYLELGIVGLSLLFFSVISAFKNVRATISIKYDFGIFQMAFLVVALFYNIMESAFKGLHLMWFIFILFALSNSKLLHLRTS